MPRNIIPIKLTGGINNLHNALNLYFRNRGELVDLVNADLTYYDQIRPLRPLLNLNSSPESAAIHSVFAGNNVVLVGSGANLKYVSGSSLSSLLTAMGGGNISFGKAGNWAFCGDGSVKQSVYLSTPVGCDWGQAIPAAGPTVAEGDGGNPDGTYQCYYRFRITLPDGTIILTALSTVYAQITVGSKKIEWSNIVHASFTGATSVQVDLYRTATGWSDTYLVTTLDEGTTTYSDDLTDEALQAKTGYSETGYWPPPSAPNLVIYHPGCDRVFCTVNNNAYWSEAAKYHSFVYDIDSATYTNINAVFLSGENATCMALIDEQLYFGSPRTWRRLRGTDPSTWIWEDTSAEKGPISARSAVLTRWGIIFAGNDGRLWLFNGFNSKPFLEKFVFDTVPDSTCHASFDGRFYRLFYGDTTYPELVVDFYGFPSIDPRVIKSTRDANCSFYDKDNDKLYLGDLNGYVRNGEDTSPSVAITLETPEVPTEDIQKMGDFGGLVIRADLKSADLTVTPKFDGVTQGALTAQTNTSEGYLTIPIDLETYRTVAFILSMTTSAAIKIYDPLILAKEDG